MPAYDTRTREEFLAHRTDEIVRFVRMGTVEPVRKGARVEMVPAVKITYSWVRATDDYTFVFQETRLADATGRVSLEDTLWADLVAGKLGEWRKIHRSGSF